MKLLSKDLLGIRDLSKEEITFILDTASGFKDVLKRDIKKVPALRGRTAVNLFFEPSTRTRTSFELAEKRLSLDVVSLSVPTSSVVKGESLIDTALNVQALGADFMVIRHSSSGVPHLIARNVHASVINAGDGINEHPTQALLDAFTIREKVGSLEGVVIAIVGDILHSRVAKSNIYLLTRYGAEVRLVGPPTLVPPELESSGVRVLHNLDEGLKGAQVVMMLRIQMERQDKGYFPSTLEYSKNWGLTRERLALCAGNVIVMHPGPINRGIEMASDVADGPESVILEQVTNGLAVRMAVMYLLGGSKE